MGLITVFTPTLVVEVFQHSLHVVIIIAFLSLRAKLISSVMHPFVLHRAMERSVQMLHAKQ